MLFTFLFLLLPLCQTHTYPPEVYDLLFGKPNFEDLFLPETIDEVITEEKNKTFSNITALETIRLSFIEENYSDIAEDLKNITEDSREADDYNEISSKLYNFTRRKWWSKYIAMTDENDWWPDWEYKKTKDMEEKKIKMFEKICLMFLHHARYKIESAFKQREKIRNDKRYKLGYLFNRLRRIKIEMLKFTAVAKKQYDFNGHECENLTSLMRIYERVVYFDIDIRDTTALINEIYSKTEPFDLVDGSATNAKGEYKVTPKMAPPNHDMERPPGHSADTLEDDYMDDLEKMKKQYGG